MNSPQTLEETYRDLLKSVDGSGNERLERLMAIHQSFYEALVRFQKAFELYKKERAPWND